MSDLHEIERMIRIILAPGPQHHSDVVRWVQGATDYKRSKIYAIAKDMPDLKRGMWALEQSPQQGEGGLKKLHLALTEAVLRQRIERGEYEDEEAA